MKKVFLLLIIILALTGCNDYLDEESEQPIHKCVYNIEDCNNKFLKTPTTCTSSAIYYKSCICGESSTTDTFEYGDLLPHDLEHHDKLDPTCTEDGHNAYDTCKNCDYTTYQNIDKLTEHNFNQEVVAYKYLKKEATCTTKAIYYKSCICGEASTTDTFEYGDLLPHDLNHHDQLNPTCTEKGHNAYDTCKNCDYTTYEEISALGHSYRNEWSYNEDNHYHLSTCGHEVISDEASHNYTSVVTIEPTHISKGLRTFTCTVCDYSYTKEIDKLIEHTFIQDVVDDKYLKQAATCTTKAIYYKSCICGKASTTDIFEYGDLLPHDLEHHNKLDPTCTEIGHNA